LHAKDQVPGLAEKWNFFARVSERPTGVFAAFPPDLRVGTVVVRGV
jgi:hypothetical protein